MGVGRLLAVLLLVSLARPAVCEDRGGRRYLRDTLASLEAMRGPEGLVADRAEILPDSGAGARLRVLNPSTSPTNIALDLLLQIGASRKPGPEGRAAERRVRKILATLAGLPFHQESGLFFSWYSTESGAVLRQDVSSVDNLHLALALWTADRLEARALLDRMDFSIFYDERNGLSGGNLRYENGRWIPVPVTPVSDRDGWDRESWDYAYLGSEARSLYSVGYALGLFRKQVNDPRFVDRVIESIQAEIATTDSGRILRTWDGGAFQLLLPERLVGESGYSKELAKSFRSYADYILDPATRKGSPFPAAYSASATGVDDYNGLEGSIALAAPENAGLLDPKARRNWEKVFTPHAAFLASAVEPARFASFFSSMENYASGKDRLYTHGIGWADGVHVRGTLRGRVVPVVLSLDQAMIALSILPSPSIRALSENAETHSRLQEFFGKLDSKLATVR